jgi:hypothetical protein
VPRVRPEDFGLSESAIAEVRARDQKQAHFFVDLLLRGCAIVWLVLTVLVYANSARRSPLLGLVMAPLLAALLLVPAPAAPAVARAGAVRGGHGRDPGVRRVPVGPRRRHAEGGRDLLRALRGLPVPGLPAALRPAGDRSAQAPRAT